MYFTKHSNYKLMETCLKYLHLIFFSPKKIVSYYKYIRGVELMRLFCFINHRKNYA